MDITRREVLALALTASVGLLAACGSDTPKAVAAPVTEDNPVVDIAATPFTQATTVRSPTTTTAPQQTTTPETTQATDPVPSIAPATSAAPSTGATKPVTGAPITVPGTLSEPLPVPKEGQEKYAQLGRIQIPAISIDAPLGEGVTLTNLNRGPGHWPGTAMPGAVGNSVIAGHRVSHSHPFEDLDKLNPGDLVTLSVATGTFTYAVTSTEIVLPTEVRILDQTDAYTSTLFACHPKHKTSHRIVVHLQLTPAPA